MKIHTRRDVLKAAINTFINNYSKYSTIPWNADIQGSVLRLRKVDPETCTEQEFESITKTSGWCTQWCDECRDECDVLMHFGDEPDYENRWQYLCRDCIVKAVAMLEKHRSAIDIPAESATK